MKHKRNQSKVHGASPNLVPVQFKFPHAATATVCVAGCFNDWQPESKPMHDKGDGHWSAEMVLSPGTYEYCLVVDGQWMPDPQATESVPNPFGGRNSVLRVRATAESIHLDEAEKLPMEVAKNSGAPRI